MGPFCTSPNTNHMPKGQPGSGPQAKTKKRAYTKRTRPSNPDTAVFGHARLDGADIVIPADNAKALAWLAYKEVGMQQKEVQLRNEFEQWWTAISHE